MLPEAQILDSIDRDHVTATKRGGQFSEIGATDDSGIRMFRWSPPFRPARGPRWQSIVAAFLSSRVAGSFKHVSSTDPYISTQIRFPELSSARNRLRTKGAH